MNEEQKLINELDQDIKQEKLHTTIIKHTPKFLAIFAAVLIVIAAKLFWDNKKNMEYQALNDKMLLAIEHFRAGSVSDANKILDEIIATGEKTADVALYIKNLNTGLIQESDLQTLKNSDNLAISELALIQDNNFEKESEIFHLFAKEKELVHAINMKDYEKAQSIIDKHFTSIQLLPSIETRLTAYKKLIEIRNKK